MKAPNLGKMVGPLPLGAWVGVTGGGLGLAYLARRQGAATATTRTVSPAADAAGAPASGFAGGGAVNLPTGASPPATPATPTPVSPEIITNDDWLGVATRLLIGRGYGAYTTQQALERYLRGEQLTAEQAAIVESAMQLQGPPPFSPVAAPPPLPAAPPVSQAPLPPQAPPPPAPPPAPPPPPDAGAAIPNFPSWVNLNPGETVIGLLPSPEPGGGWYLSNYGGVFNVGPAPMLGAPRNEGFGPPGDRRAVSIVPLGRGYRVISNHGENYNYPR